MEPNQDFDKSFYVLCCAGYLILGLDLLATPAGCERVKSIFRDAMLAAGSYEAWKPCEFQAAMRDMQRAERGEFSNPPEVVSWDDPTPAQNTLKLNGIF